MTGMFDIISKESLNPTVARITVSAPRIARKAEPGQFVILRAKENSERIPLTVADYDREAGTVSVIYQIVGAGTMELDTLGEGDCLRDLVGPLGVPTHTEGLKKVCIVGGGVGCAIAYPVAKKLHSLGCEVHSVVGFRSSELVILEDAFRVVSSEFRLMTDDGSRGEKGLVTDALEKVYAFESARGNEKIGLRLAHKTVHLVDYDPELYARLEEHSLRGDTVEVLSENGATLQIVCGGEVLFQRESVLIIGAGYALAGEIMAVVGCALWLFLKRTIQKKQKTGYTGQDAPKDVYDLP